MSTFKTIVIVIVALSVLAVLVPFVLLFFSSIGYKAVNKDASDQYYTKGGDVYFVRMGNFFELGASKIEGADSASFQVLAEGYAKDASRVYFQKTPIANADPTTFTVLTSVYAKDKNHVFFMESVLNQADPASFETINNSYAKDSTHVFFDDQILEGADVKTFEYLWGLFSMDASRVYYETQAFVARTGTPERIPHDEFGVLLRLGDLIYSKEPGASEVATLDIADPKTFSLVPGEKYYARDSQYIYRSLRRIPNSDPASFEIINERFATDKNHTYYQGNIIVETDPSIYASYQITNEYDYYFFHPDAQSILIAPRSQVTELSYGHLKYNNRIFVYMDEIRDVDVDSFQLLQDSYAKDKNNVYYRSEEIAGADATTFTILNDQFSKDKNNVYFEHLILKDVSPDDFIYKEGMYGTKIDNTYAELKIRDAGM